MKIAFLFLIFIRFSGFAQCDSSEIIDFPKFEARFAGGAAQMKKFFQENIEYPEFAELDEIGRIYIEFIVCQDGSITDITFRREVAESLEQMSIEFISKMPNWIPAEHNGEIVASRCRLPITICFH